MDSKNIIKQGSRHSSGRWLIWGVLGVLLFSVWFVLGPGLRLALGHVGPWVAGLAGYEVGIGEMRGSLWSALEARDVTVQTASGTDVQMKSAKIHLTRVPREGSSVPRWGLTLDGLRGKIVRQTSVESVGLVNAPGEAVWFWAARWPSEIAVRSEWLIVETKDAQWELRDFRVRLSEGATGEAAAAGVILSVGNWQKAWTELQARATWHEGTLSLWDLSLAEDVIVDNFTWNFGRSPFALLVARAFGGYVQGDWQGARERESKAAVNIYQVGLDSAGKFFGVSEPVKGRLKVAKLTFNGDVQQPLSAQISLRLEADGFAWRDRAFDEITLGLSLAGRRLRINEGALLQKKNKLSLRGTLFVPADRAAWRQAPFEFEASAEVREVRRLHALLGFPRGEWSGGMQVDGSAAGKLGDGAGWLRVRGWDLRTKGIPPTALQADLRLDGSRLDFVSAGAQSGPNNADARGHIDLGENLAYQGRLELRVRDVSRYLELLGRRAPDWAREGDVKLLWEGDGMRGSHSGVADLELAQFIGDLNPVPVNARMQATYAPGSVYVSRLKFDRGPLELTTSLHFGEKGLGVKNIELFNARTRLLWGEMFLPLSLDAVLDLRPWKETVMEDREVFATLRSDNMDLVALVQLLGQETTLLGKVDMSLDAKGPWRSAVIDGQLSIGGLAARFPAFRIPSSQLTMTLGVKDRRAAMSGSWLAEGAKPVEWSASVPLIGTGDEDGWTLVDQRKSWEIDLKMPGVEVAGISPKLGQAAMDQGQLSGQLQVTGMPSEPAIKGEIMWTSGRITMPPGWAPLREVETKVVFRGTEAVLEETRASIGDGTIGLTGRVNFADRGNPAWEILLRGENAGFYEDDNLQLVARGDIEARGDNRAGAVRGALDLAGSVVRRGVMLKPVLAEEPAAPLVPPTGFSAGPWSAWDWSVNMFTHVPLAVGTDGAGGGVRPEVSIGGTLGEPLLLGTVHVEQAVVRLPTAATLSAAGKLHFTREKPWVPVMDVVGLGEAQSYNIRAGVFGPLGERNLYLSSTPELTVEQIVMLLATGIAPEPKGASPEEFVPEERIKSEPSWLDLGKIRGLLGWGAQAATDAAPWMLGDNATGYTWEWK